MRIIESKIDPVKKIVYEDINKNCFYSIVFINPNNAKCINICVSSQIGCVENCTFCATGSSIFVRNLTANEIFNQVMDGIQSMNKLIVTNGVEKIHLQFEGMGEASKNLKSCFESIIMLYSFLTSLFIKIEITFATVGNINMKFTLFEFLDNNKIIRDNIKFKIKFSLHACFEKERNYLCPSISKQYTIDVILKNFYELCNYLNTKLICNYLLLDFPNGKNNYSNIHMRELEKKLIIDRTIIFLSYYSDTKKGYSSPNDSIFAYWFSNFKNKGYDTRINKIVGADIGAACGMLDYLEDGFVG